MNVDDILKSIGERIKATAKVDTIYGEPRDVSGKTVIPIAKVGYGFGAGAGEEKGGEGEKPGFGGGGGGGVSTQPVGFLIGSDDEIKFLPITDWRRIGWAALAGFLLGIFIMRKAARK